MTTSLKSHFRKPHQASDILFMLHATHIVDDYMKFCKVQILNRLSFEAKLTYNELNVLLMIVWNGNCVTLRAIVDLLRQAPATVTRTSKKLKKYGLLEIQSNSSDKRSIDLVATDTGKDLCEQFKHFYYKSFDAIWSKYNLNFSDEEKSSFINILERLSSYTGIIASERAMLNLDNTSAVETGPFLEFPSQAV